MTTTPRSWIVLAVLSLAFFGGLVSALIPKSQAQAAPPSVAPGEIGEIGVDIADLRQQLVSVLKCRRPAEFEFIDRVVAKVNNGTLPVPIVNSAFNFARVKKPYPFPYFQASLIELAAREGIVVE